MGYKLRNALVVAVVAITVVSMATAGVSADTFSASQRTSKAPVQTLGDLDSAESTNADHTDARIVLVNEQTGEQLVLAPDTNLNSLALTAGDYTAYHYSEEGDVVQTIQFHVQESNAVSSAGDSAFSAAEPTANTDYEVGVVVGSGFDKTGYSGTIDIYAGVMDTSGDIQSPVSDVFVTIEIRGPDGETTQYSRTTNENGNAHLELDTGNLADGDYQVEVLAENIDSTGYESFTVGQTTRFYPGISNTIQTGEQTTVTIQVTDNTVPVPNVERTVTITRPDGSTTEQTVTTDETGTASLTFTPEQAGEYRFSTPETYGLTLAASGKVAKVHLNGDRFSANVGAETPVGITGQVRDGGLAANEEITLSIVNTTDWDNEFVAKNITTTTNSFGQFEASWTPDSDQVGEYEVRLYDADGSKIGTGSSRIDVIEPSEAGPGSDASVDAEFTTDLLAPGSSTTAVVEVTNNGDPVANKEVSVLTHLEYNEVPLAADTITTNESGQATVDINIPTTAPDAASLYMDAVATVNGATVDDTAYGDIQSIQVDEQRPRQVTSGEQSTYTYTATAVDTGEPIEGLTYSFIGETSGYHAETFSADTTQTNASGVAKFSFDVPGDASSGIHIGDGGPYVEFYSFPYLDVQDYDVSVNGLPDNEVQAGETLTLSYDADADSATSAELVIKTYSDLGANTVLAATTLSEGSETTVTIPESVPEETYYQVELRTVSETGSTSSGDEYLWVTEGDNQNDPPTAAFDVTPDSPVAGESVTFDAGASSDPDGSISQYVWDFDNDGNADATGESVTRELSAGSHDVTLEVTDNDGATAATTQTITVQEAAAATEATIVLTNAPDGLQKYNITVISPAGTTLTKINPGVISGQEFQIVDGGPGEQFATVRGVDLSGRVGPSDELELVTIGLDTGVEPADISFEIIEITDDSGESISPSNLEVQIQDSPFDAPIGGGDAPPKDPDGDGLYEDINGDGEATFQDAVAIAFINGDDLSSDQVAALDFDGDGDVDFGDAVALAFAI